MNILEVYIILHLFVVQRIISRTGIWTVRKVVHERLSKHSDGYLQSGLRYHIGVWTYSFAWGVAQRGCADVYMGAKFWARFEMNALGSSRYCIGI